MQFTWDEAKRKSNLAKHGYDFADAHKVFAGTLVLANDGREDYGEQCMLALRHLDAVIVHNRPCGICDTDTRYLDEKGEKR